MEALIAKRYVKALVETMSLDELQKTLDYLEAVAALFKDRKIKDILLSPEIKEEQKAQWILDSLKGADEKIKNFIKILAQKKRIAAIPDIVKELQRKIAQLKQEYEGVIYSNFDLQKSEIAKIEDALSKKAGAKIHLKKSEKPYDGIKVEVDTIGLEIDFSMPKIKKQLIENILKAI